MNFLKCAGIINNEYYYANGSSFVFPNRTDPASKSITINSNIDFIFDRGCVYDGYNSTYILGTSRNDPDTITTYRVSTLENDNATISVDESDQLTFSHTPDLNQPVLFIARNNNIDPVWCALYNSNDSDIGNVVWEDCNQSNGPENITATSNISNLNNWMAGSNSSVIYQLTNTKLMVYNASTSNITYDKTYVLNDDLSLIQNSPWSFTVAGFSNLLEFAVTDGVKVKTVTVPYNAQNGASASVNIMNNTNVQLNSSFVFSNDENSTLQIIDGNGIKQLAALSQISVTQTHTTGSADPTTAFVTPTPSNINQNQILSTGQIVGIAVGSGIAFLLIIAATIFLFCVLPKRRKKRGLSIATTSTSPIICSENLTHGYAARNVGLDTLNSSQEGDPDFAEYPSVFNNSCDIRTDEDGIELSEGLFLRKCTYSRSKSPAIIHYFTSEQKERFDQSLMVLKNLNGQSDRVLQLFKAFKLSSPSPKYQIEYILISSGYEPKNNLHTLYAKEGDLHNYIDLSDDVFKVWVTYSILTALHALHRKGFSHSHLSLETFYAETSAPSMDWILGDFYYSQVNNPEEKANDILRVGHMIYNIVFEQAPQAQEENYSNIQLDTSKIKGPYKEHFAYLLERTFYSINSKQTSAEELLEYWKKHFRFS
ncbi:hypothetical protein K501DRAFT_331849 [Backusella circina FSU 941]|nr:hypothetical protein K501DRAFT_331849 [Backusella circina FSU 941]